MYGDQAWTATRLGGAVGSLFLAPQVTKAERGGEGSQGPTLVLADGGGRAHLTGIRRRGEARSRLSRAWR